MEVYRGEIFYIKRSGNVTGSEQESGRPAVIVSNDVGNKHSNIIEVVYLTTKQKNPLPTHAKINCQVQSTALCERIVSVSKERLGDYIRTCTEIRVETERDLYKNLYEQMIERVIES